MKILHKNQSIERNNSNVCVVTEYPPVDQNFDFAIVNISGRYPNEQRAVNTQCKEMAYVQEGIGKVVVNYVEYPLHTGDIVLIDINEKFYWEGNLKLFICCNPAFDINQHQLVE